MKYSIKSPLPPTPSSWNGQHWLFDDAHAEFYGYLSRFVEYMKAVNATAKRFDISIEQFLRLQEAGHIRPLGWTEEDTMRADYLSLL